jgi:predicted O-methyltransferase YrrM
MSSLSDSRLADVLSRLHSEAAGDGVRWTERRQRQSEQPVPTGPDPLIRMGDLYIAVSREEGEFLYFLARACHARKMVEFGASYGISTLYLGAAARDNGGHLLTTEVHPQKCAVASANITAAGLTKEVELLAGDALETLGSRPGPVDLVFLDGWKSLYLPVLKLLLPKLSAGCVVVADNIDFEAAQDYVNYVSTPGGKFFTHVSGNLGLSYYSP